MDSIDKKLITKRNIIYVLMVFTLLYIMGIVIGIDINISTQLLFVLIGGMLVKFFLFNPLFLYAIIAITSIIAVLVHRYYSPILFVFTDRVIALLENIYLNMKGKEIISSGNSLIFWAILLFLISLFTAIVLFKKRSIFWLLPFYIGIFLYYWYNFIDRAYLMLIVFLLLFFLLMGLNKYHKEGMKVKRLYSSWQNTVIKYSVLIVLISYLIPKGFFTVQWPWLYQRVYTTFPIIENLRATSSYSRPSGIATLFNFELTGFQSDSSRLGGPVILNDKIIMILKSDKDTYLRGNIKRTYTGSSWESSLNTPKNYQLGQEFSQISKEESLFYKETEITITNKAFASTTLFSPYKAVKVNFDDNSTLNVTQDDALILPHGIYDGETYSIKVYEPLPYGVQIYLGIDQRKDNIKDLWSYLQLPDDRITDRTRRLVKDITKNEDTDYKKALVIENYLRENYQYNLSVKDVPPGYEFVDYFLFEELQGYCTYYASAMAVMLRLEGIPTRYVEGYIAQDSEIDGIYEVSQKNAHAWIEAFIEPVGWMTFEATPVYPIEDRQENFVDNDDVEANNPNEDDQNGFLPGKFTRGPQDVNDGDISNGEFDPNMLDSKYTTNEGLSENTINTLIIILLLIIPIRFIIGLLQFKYQELIAKKLNNNGRIIYYYDQIVKLNALQEYPQLIGETHNEYANRIAYKFFKYNEKGIKEITEIFVKSKYSQLTATDDEVSEVIKYKLSLDKRLKHFLGIRKYYYSKYIKSKYWKS